MKLLVVKHPSTSNASLGAGLESFGYKIDRVTNGSEAITYASFNNYDVIILDLMLPKESSLLVLHEIRGLDGNVEIIVLSSPEQIHDRVTALIQGADDYLVKPFPVDDLHACIQSLMYRKSSSDSGSKRILAATESSTHINRLIENLLRRCHCEHGAIELVISEIKLSSLLDRVCLNLVKNAPSKKIKLPISRAKLPTLLVDAKWMEHLLVNLLTNAIIHSPQGSEIRIDVNADTEYCSLVIESQMAESLSSEELKTMFKSFCDVDKNSNAKLPIAGPSLAKSYADYMNLSLNASINKENYLKIQVSNIKII